jgi:hypothetical protein
MRKEKPQDRQEVAMKGSNLTLLIVGKGKKIKNFFGWGQVIEVRRYPKWDKLILKCGIKTARLEFIAWRITARNQVSMLKKYQYITFTGSTQLWTEKRVYIINALLATEMTTIRETRNISLDMTLFKISESIGEDEEVENKLLAYIRKEKGE